MVVLHHEPGKHLAKNRVWVFHPYLFIGLFEGNRDKVEESVNEGGVHVDDVVALLECHAVGDFDVGAIIGVGASTIVGYICNFERKRVVRIGVCLAAKVVAVEGGINGNVQDNHLFGDGGLVCLGTLAQVLKEIVRTKRLGVPKLDSGGVGVTIVGKDSFMRSPLGNVSCPLGVVLFDGTVDGLVVLVTKAMLNG